MKSCVHMKDTITLGSLEEEYSQTRPRRRTRLQVGTLADLVVLVLRLWRKVVEDFDLPTNHDVAGLSEHFRHKWVVRQLHFAQIIQ